jgi:hypothetical protein
MPSDPSVTASRAAESATIVMTTSARRAASAGVVAAVAPASTSDSAFAGVRFHTVSSCPASSSRRAIRPPIPPTPIKAILVMVP